MTTTTSILASPAVSAYLNTASKERTSWYLTQGEPQALSMTVMTEAGLERRILPGLMGLVVGKPTATAEKAIAVAEGVRDGLLADPSKLEPFDVVEAEIDDEAVDLSRAFSDASLRIEDIAHIGTMQDGSPSDVLVRLIEDMAQDLDHPASALTDIPFLASILIENEGRIDEGVMDDVLMGLHDHGRQGFLISASVPEMKPTGENSFSVHYGTRRVDVFYGSTYAVACRKALAWAEREVESMRTGIRTTRTPLLKTTEKPMDEVATQPDLF
jgi:hypothetical protein